MTNNRNKLCWCGSGVKYKKCHLNRERLPEHNVYEASKKLYDGRKKVCSVPDTLKNECSGGIINAHTISKSSSLKKISRNGHVYRLVHNLSNKSRYLSPVKLELVGLNKASTLTIFCKRHDAVLFSPIENKEFQWELEQIFLISYRSFIYEWYAKMGILDQESLFKRLDQGKDIISQISIQSDTTLYMMGVKTAARDLAIFKSEFDEMLISKDYSRLKYLGFEFQEPLPVMGAGGFEPLFDLNGIKLQDLLNLDKVAQPVYYSTFAVGNKGIFLMSWLDKFGPACEQFSVSIQNLDKNQIKNFIVSLMFSESENIYISPDWWDAQSKKIRGEFIDLFEIKASFDREQSKLQVIQALENSEFKMYRN